MILGVDLKTNFYDFSVSIFTPRSSITVYPEQDALENVFGIMAATWRIYGSKIALQPEKVEKFTLATCVLHNYSIAIRQI